MASLNLLLASRFQDSSLERTKTHAIDSQGQARLAFEMRPEPPHLHDEVAEASRELGRHHDRLRQNFDSRVSRLHRLVDLGYPEFIRAVHICQDLDLRRKRLVEVESGIESLLDIHQVGRMLTTIKRIGAPIHSKSADACAAYVGTLPGLKQSGQIRAPLAPHARARMRMALWMAVLGTVRRNIWLRAFDERLRAAVKPATLAFTASMRKLLYAGFSVTKHRKPFTIRTNQPRAA